MVHGCFLVTAVHGGLHISTAIGDCGTGIVKGAMKSEFSRYSDMIGCVREYYIWCVYVLILVLPYWSRVLPVKPSVTHGVLRPISGWLSYIGRRRSALRQSKSQGRWEQLPEPPCCWRFDFCRSDLVVSLWCISKIYDYLITFSHYLGLFLDSLERQVPVFLLIPELHFATIRPLIRCYRETSISDS
jgi:hypothetical protein